MQSRPRRSEKGSAPTTRRRRRVCPVRRRQPSEDGDDTAPLRRRRDPSKDDDRGEPPRTAATDEGPRGVRPPEAARARPLPLDEGAAHRQPREVGRPRAASIDAADGYATPSDATQPVDLTGSVSDDGATVGPDSPVARRRAPRAPLPPAHIRRVYGGRRQMNAQMRLVPDPGRAPHPIGDYASRERRQLHLMFHGGLPLGVHDGALEFISGFAEMARQAVAGGAFLQFSDIMDPQGGRPKEKDPPAALDVYTVTFDEVQDWVHVGDTCLICCDPLREQALVTTACLTDAGAASQKGHVFHAGCIDQWRAAQAEQTCTCPVCKRFIHAVDQPLLPPPHAKRRRG